MLHDCFFLCQSGSVSSAGDYTVQINAFVNIKKVYIKRIILQLELIRYPRSKNVAFIHLYFYEATDSMQYRPPNAYEDVSNTNQFDHRHFWMVIIGDSS